MTTNKRHKRMTQKKTSLSAGAIIRSLLLADDEVKRRANKVFPIVIDQAQLPYILYRRASLQHNPTKAGAPGADTVAMEVCAIRPSMPKAWSLPRR